MCQIQVAVVCSYTMHALTLHAWYIVYSYGLYRSSIVYYSLYIITYEGSY